MGLLNRSTTPAPEGLQARLDDAEQAFIESVQSVQSEAAQRDQDIAARLAELEAEKAQIASVRERAARLRSA